MTRRQLAGLETGELIRRYWEGPSTSRILVLICSATILSGRLTLAIISKRLANEAVDVEQAINRLVF